MAAWQNLNQNLLLVLRHQSDYSKDTSRLMLIDMDTGVSSIVCGNNSLHTFCHDDTLLIPGFILLANETLYITSDPQRSPGFGATTYMYTHNFISFKTMAIKSEFSISMSLLLSSFKSVEL